MLSNTEGTGLVIGTAKKIKNQLHPRVNDVTQLSFFPILWGNKSLSPEQALAAKGILSKIFSDFDSHFQDTTLTLSFPVP